MRSRSRCSVLAVTLLIVATLSVIAATPALAATAPALGVGDVRVMEPFSTNPQPRQ